MTPSAQQVADPRIGSTVQAEFLIERKFGEDELGALYEAQNTRRKGRYQILFPRKDLSPPLKVMVAVRNELRKARELTPLGLLPTEQLADAKGDACFATELPQGETLAEHLARGPLSPGTALPLCAVIGRVLSVMHAAGMAHGRLRPEHVVLVPPDAKGPHAGRAMILGHSLHYLLRHPGSAGSAEWMRSWPAEQLSAKVLKAEPRGDVFALGVLLYQCLAGQPAFAGDTVAQLIEAQRKSPLLSEGGVLKGELVRPLNVVLAAACAGDVAARIADVGEFLRALRQVAKGANLPFPAEEDGPSGRQSSIVRRLSGIFRIPAALGSLRPPERPVAQTADFPIVDGTVDGTPPPLPPPPPVGAVSGKPPPLPRNPVGDVVDRPTVQLDRVAQVPSSKISASTGAMTIPIQRIGEADPSGQKRADTTVRLVRPRDITQLVQLVQEGQVDPNLAVEQAQLGEDVNLKGVVVSPLVAAVLGALLVLLLVALLRC